MSFSELYWHYLKGDNSYEQPVYDFLLSNNNIDIGIASIWKVPSLHIFTLLLDRIVPQRREVKTLLRNLIHVKGKIKYIEYLFNKYPFLKDEVIICTTLDQAREAALTKLTEGRSQCLCYFNQDVDIHDALNYGLFPYKLGDYLPILENAEVPIDTLKFQYDDSQLSELCHLLKMATQDRCEIIQEIYESTVLFRWFYPHLLYKSKRIKTNMGMFRTPFSNVGIRKSNILDTDFGEYKELVLSEGIHEGKFFVPITRYATSTHTGKYYPKPPKEKVCGTFYYHEEESDTCLIANNFLVASTKCSATIYLSGNINTVVEEYLIDVENRNWEEGVYKPDLMYTPIEAVNLGLFPQEEEGGVKYNEVPQFPSYYGNLIGLYAQEDVFDQPLCLLAKSRGIDLVVLTRMVGSKQVVIEVLDARDREDSFKNLIYT